MMASTTRFDFHGNKANDLLHSVLRLHSGPEFTQKLNFTISPSLLLVSMLKRLGLGSLKEIKIHDREQRGFENNLARLSACTIIIYRQENKCKMLRINLQE